MEAVACAGDASERLVQEETEKRMVAFSYKEAVGDSSFSGVVELDIGLQWVEKQEGGNGHSRCRQLFPEVCL